jgi:hypothetical protein
MLSSPTNQYQIMRRFVLLLSCIAGISCQDLTSAELPAGTKNPQEYETREGALALYRGAVATFHRAILGYLEQSGVLTDEYTVIAQFNTSVDLRRIPSNLNLPNDYQRLHEVRGQTQQALGALARYASDLSPALRGHLFALQAYAEILLADLYCSGIPLSTLDFEGDFTYKPASRTEEVYAHALTLLDSALALSGDSLRVEYLARIGRARILLQSAKYQEAAEAVQMIPPTYRYAVRGIVVPSSTILSQGVTVSDLEGGTGLSYRNDLRVEAVFIGNHPSTGRQVYQPRKYLPAGSTQQVVVASGAEVQLIQAEADLHAGRIEQWLERLNALRTDSTFQVEGTDTVWGPGLGASLFAATPTVAAAQRGLPPLTDPAQGVIPPGQDSTDVRVNLLFAERAYWLFLTGHRQGDLRRLVREYGRPQNAVYPSQGGIYGTDVTLPITMQMEGSNPHFQGCIHRDA